MNENQVIFKVGSVFGLITGIRENKKTTHYNNSTDIVM